MESFLIPFKANQTVIFTNNGVINSKGNQSQIHHWLKQKESHKEHFFQRENLIQLRIISKEPKLIAFLSIKNFDLLKLEIWPKSYKQKLTIWAIFISNQMEASSKHKLSFRVKIFKPSLKKEESKVSVNLKSLTDSVSFYKFSRKEVLFYLFSNDQIGTTSNRVEFFELSEDKISQIRINLFFKFKSFLWRFDESTRSKHGNHQCKTAKSCSNNVWWRLITIGNWKKKH